MLFQDILEELYHCASTGDAERLDEILNENEGFDLNIQDEVCCFEHLIRIMLWVVSSFLSFFTAGWVDVASCCFQ